ncbi:MAG: heavy-metal-associated domain-containing protein [Candidatus Humimicrobiaceae bacterium]|nr:heavy metal-associated domain-containing protein [Actinomycetota bacterium]
MFSLNINLSGLKCNACVKLVKSKVGKIDGIKSVDVNLSGETCIISERLVTKDEIKHALSETDFGII